MNRDKLLDLAIDLRTAYPRSPREILGGHVIVARCLDKCRAFLVGINGEYNFTPCSLCEVLSQFTGIKHDDFKDFVATGATDEEVGRWVKENSKVTDEQEIIRWNNKMRDMKISDMDDEMQAFLERYIPNNLPKHPPVYVWFDVFDIEEKRI